jgi:hypothetical protein
VPFPDHVHPLVALQGSPRCLERKEAHPWLDTPFDEPVILLDQIIYLSFAQINGDVGGCQQPLQGID